jgi:LacI family transcriptional regulator
MDILNDKKNTAVVVVIAVLAIGGATLSCIHFLSSPPPIPRIVAPSGSEPQNIGTDNRNASRVVVEHLIKLGHRRIGYVLRVERVTSVEECLGGYRDALESHGIRFDPELVTSGWPHARLALDHYRTLSDPPTALAALHDFAAFELIHEAQARGIKVPEDLSVVGFDDVESYSPRTGMLTTVHQPFFEIDRRAGELILLRHSSSGFMAARSHRHIFLPASLVVRTSCSAPY